jgi:trehalose 6-phosphate phosphatase
VAASNTTTDLPSALVHGEDIARRLQDKRVALFLDYDGSLTPIVERPDQALLSKTMRQTIRQLATHCPVAIISGRDRTDVQHLVHIDTIIYAGSHGFDIAGPQSMPLQYERGADFLPAIEQAERALRQKLAGVVGALVERKKFTIAVHVRAVAHKDQDAVERIVDDILACHPELRKGYGKKVFELLPRLDWHKGKAVLWLLQALQLEGPAVLPLYIGDDLTDEDAFKVIADRGLGLVVDTSPRPTAASYILKNPDEVEAFLQQLLSWLQR